MWIIKIVDSTATNTWWLGSSAKKLTEGYVHGLLSGDIEIHYELDVFTKQYSTPDVTLEFTNAPYRTVTGTSNYRSRLSDEWYNIKNASVTIYQDLGGATAIADCLQVFKGFVPFGASVSGGRILLRVLGSNHRVLPATIPTTQIKDIFPEANEETADKYLPLVYGNYIWNTRQELNISGNNALIEAVPVTIGSKPTFAIADHAVGTPTKIYTKNENDLFEIALSDYTYASANALYLSKPTMTPIDGIIQPFKEVPLHVVHPREFISETKWNQTALGIVNSIDVLQELPSTGTLSGDGLITTSTRIFDSYDDGIDQYGLAYLKPIGSLVHKDFGNPKQMGVILYVGAQGHKEQESTRVTFNLIETITITGGSGGIRWQFGYPSETMNVLVPVNNAWNDFPFLDWSYGLIGIDSPILELTFRRWRGAVKNAIKGDYILGNVYEARFSCKYNFDKIDNMLVACSGKKFGNWIDEGGRTNSFSVGDAITSPVYAIESLLRDYAGLTSDEIDMDSFDSCNMDTGQTVVVNTKQQQINLIVAEEGSIGEYIKIILEQTWVAMVETPFGKLKLIDLWNINPTIKRTIPVSHFVAEYPGGPPKIAMSRSTFTAPAITVDVNPPADNFTRATTPTGFNTRRMKYFKEGSGSPGVANPWQGKWPHITNESASNYVAFLMGSKAQGTQGFWSTEHIQIEFETVGGTNADLQIGDFISIDAGMDYILKCYGQSWSGRAFMVTAVTNLLDRTRLKCIELYNRLVPSSGGAVVTWSATEGTKIPTTDGAIVSMTATEGTRPFSVGEDAEFRVLAVLISEIYCGIELPSE